jgi:two-component system nitrogen regulation response regulator GlnG
VFDYIPSPVNPDDVIAAVKRIKAYATDTDAMRAQARSLRDEGAPIVGRSAPMQKVYRTFARLVGFDLTVLVQGEAGSGKGTVARALHDLGHRRHMPFVQCNLAGASCERVEAELLGDSERPAGLLAQAEGGTLFLDEIGDIPADAQTRLTRILDSCETMIEGPTGRRPKVRLIASTSRDLGLLVAQGLFRKDLYFRLNIASVRLPPLRERTDDIPDLARAFLLRVHRDGQPLKAIESAALQRLKAHAWPGNVRELENLMRRICVLYDQELITAHMVEHELQDQDLAPALPTDQADRSAIIDDYLGRYFSREAIKAAKGKLFEQILLDVQRPLIQRALLDGHGNQSRAAQILGLNRNTLRRKINDLGLEAKPPGARRRNARPSTAARGPNQGPFLADGSSAH